MIIARYLVKETLQTLFAVALVLMLIGLSAQLVGLFAEVTAGNLGIDTVMTILGLKSLRMLLVILPLSLYLAVLMTLSRFYQNNEMAAISACGVSQLYVLRATLTLSFLFAIGVGLLSLQLVPWANSLQQKIVVESENQSDMEGISAGRFKEMSSGVGVIYVESFNEEHTKMKNIFLQRKDKKSETIVKSQTGYYQVDNETGDRFMVFENGMRYEGQPRQEGFAVVNFARHGVRVKEKNTAKYQKKHTTIPTRQLFEKWNVVTSSEFHSRLAPIFLCLLLPALAIPLSQTSPRQGRYTRLGFGLVIYILFSNLINVGKVWIVKKQVSMALGLWWVHALLLLLVVLLFMHQTGFRYLFFKAKKV